MTTLVRNSETFEANERLGSVIEIWEGIPIYDSDDGAFRNENFFDGIEMIDQIQLTEFEQCFEVSIKNKECYLVEGLNTDNPVFTKLELVLA